MIWSAVLFPGLVADWHWHTQWEGSVGQEGIAGFLAEYFQYWPLGSLCTNHIHGSLPDWLCCSCTDLSVGDIFCPPIFSPSAPSKAASMQKFFPNWGESCFSKCFLPYPLINLRRTFVSALRCLTAALVWETMWALQLFRGVTVFL